MLSESQSQRESILKIKKYSTEHEGPPRVETSLLLASITVVTTDISFFGLVNIQPAPTGFT